MHKNETEKPPTVQAYIIIHIFPVLGFNPSTFVGIEQGVTFSVEAGFLSGKPPQGGSLTLDLVLGTASKPLHISSSYFTYSH